MTDACSEAWLYIYRSHDGGAWNKKRRLYTHSYVTESGDTKAASERLGNAAEDNKGKYHIRLWQYKRSMQINLIF